MNNDSECQMKKVMTLILKWKCDSERQDEDVALKAKMKMNNGFECRNEKCDDIELKAYDGSERRTERMAMNVKLKVIAMNAKQKQRL